MRRCGCTCRIRMTSAFWPSKWQPYVCDAVLKRLQSWKEALMDCMILCLCRLSQFYVREIRHGLSGQGNFHLWNDIEPVVSECVPQLNYRPDDIVDNIRSAGMGWLVPTWHRLLATQHRPLWTPVQPVIRQLPLTAAHPLLRLQKAMQNRRSLCLRLPKKDRSHSQFRNGHPTS